MRKRCFKQYNTIARGFAVERFSTSNINYGIVMKEIRSNLDKLRNKEIIENEFADELYKLVLREDDFKTRRDEFANTIRNAVWITDEVIKLALKETTRIVSDMGYSDDVVADALETIADVFVMRGSNTLSPEDISGLDLFYDHRFVQIIDLFKYGLAPGNYISSKNIARILRALIRLEYKDITVQEMVQKKLVTNRYLSDSEVEDSLQAAKLTQEEIMNLPLITKKGFYHKGEVALTDATLHTRFNGYVNYLINHKDKVQDDKVEKIVSKEEEDINEVSRQLVNLLKSMNQSYLTPKEKQEKQQSTQTNEKTPNPEDLQKLRDAEEVGQALDHLKGVFEKSKLSLFKFSESILQLRDIYSKLGEAQQKDFVYQNSSLMIDLMEVEELLLEAGVINVADLKQFDKKGEITREIKRIGPLMRQLLHEYTGSTMILEHLEHFPTEENKEANNRMKSENGMYQNNTLEAFSALIDYANLESRDIDPNNTYSNQSFAGLINPEYERESHIYQVEKRPLVALRNMYHDALVDRRKLSVGRTPYLLSARKIREFMLYAVNSRQVNLVKSFKPTQETAVELLSLASRIQQQELVVSVQDRLTTRTKDQKRTESPDIVPLDFNRYLDNYFKNPNTIKISNLVRLEDELVLEKFIEASKLYNDMKIEDKVSTLYNLALWGSSSEIGRVSFKLFYTYLIKNQKNFWELCSNQDNHWLPLPTNLKKMHFVYFLASSQNLPTADAFEYVFNQIHLSKRMNFGLEDNRDPLYNLLRDTLKNLLTDSAYSSTEVNLGNKFADELQPISEVRSGSGHNLVIFLRHLDFIGPKSTITFECESQSKLIEQYLTKKNKKQVLAVNIPYNIFIKEGPLGQIELKEKEEISEILSNIYQVLSVVNIQKSFTSNLYQLIGAKTENMYSHLLEIEPWRSISEFLESSFELASHPELNYPRSFIDSTIELKSSLFNVMKYMEGDKLRFSQSISNLKINIYLFHQTIFKLESGLIEEFLNHHHNIDSEYLTSKLQSINQSLSELEKASSAKSIKMKRHSNPVFLGRKQGIDMIDASIARQEKKMNPLEFFNYEYLSNPEFFSYSDWEKEVTEQKPIFKHFRLDLGQTSTPYGYVNYGFVPSEIADFDIARPSMYPLFWERKVFNFNFKLNEKLDEFDQMIYPEKRPVSGADDAGSEIGIKLALEKFKYGFKFKRDLKEQLDILFSLRVYDTILERGMNKVESRPTGAVKRIKRCADAYVDYLERLQNERRTRSRFFRFSINYATKHEDVTYWRDVVYNKLPSMYRVVSFNFTGTQSEK